jgi:hypothetical protein
MRPTYLLLPCAIGLGCSPSSSPGAAHEAGTDATADATDDSCFPVCSSGSSSGGGGGDDGGSDASCAALKSQVEMLQAPAQACDPTKPTQCAATAQGLCCPITVTSGTDTAVNAFAQAVTTFATQCDAGCLTPVCPTAPSLHCNAVGMQGVCQ